MELNWTYFFSLFALPLFWRAVLTVVELASLVWLIGLGLGFVVASALLCSVAPLRALALAYVGLFRSLPPLVLLVLVFNLPHSLAATGPALAQPFVAGLLALVLTESAAMAEIHRGSLALMARGQHEAGRALGLGYWGIQTRIVLPQAFRMALPRLVHEYITVIQLTSLVWVIALPELLQTGQRLYRANAGAMEPLLAAAVFYLLLVWAFAAAFGWLVRRLDLQRRHTAALDDTACGALRSSLRRPPLVLRAAATPGAPLALEMRGISKSRGPRKLLDGLQLRVAAGEVISLIGPSGAGKTALLRGINALEPMDSGEIILFGESYFVAGDNPDGPRIRAGVRRIGMVFPGFKLFAHLTLLDNLLLAPRYHGACSDASGLASSRNLALGLLDKVGLLAHAHSYPQQLTGGQQQRAAIARALALRPDILLLDEPTATLEAEQVGEVLRVIQRLAKEGMTLLIATHEMAFALTLSDRVVFLEGGRLLLDVPPYVLRNQPYPNEALLRVRKFMGMASHGGAAVGATA